LSIAALLGVLDIVGLAGLFAEPGPPPGVAVSEHVEELSFWERMVDAWTPVQAWARGAR